jgi:hypothetical protein
MTIAQQQIKCKDCPVKAIVGQQEKPAGDLIGNGAPRAALKTGKDRHDQGS